MISRSINRWWTVAAGTLGGALGAGTVLAYMYGIMAVPMGAAFGWDRSLLATNTTAFLFGSGVGSVCLGFLISRFGIRGPAALFVALFGTCFALVGVLPPVAWLHHGLFVLIGIGGAACTAMPYSVAISGLFDKHRGLALGIVVAGTGLGATFAPRLIEPLLEDIGWRAAFITVGAVTGLIPALGLIFLVRTPKGVVGRKTGPDGHVPTPLATIAADPTAWKILFPILCVSLAGWGAMGPLFQDRGASAATIAAILSFAGLVSWIARLAVGYLLDKIFAPFLCAGIFALTALGLVLLTAVPNEYAAYIGAALIAMALGTEGDMVTYLASRYFKLVDFSRVVGLLWVLWSWGGGLGLALTFSMFKLTGGYGAPFGFFAALLIMGAIVICFLGPYRDASPHDTSGSAAG